MKYAYSSILLVFLLVGGCPSQDPSAKYQASVEALISVSTTSGEAPLQVVVSGVESTSTRGAIVKYIWDFAGQAGSNEMTAAHTFSSPGRYPITLTVVDTAGEQASNRVYVRVQGGDVTAVISANRLSGPAPLVVQFDGTGSTATGDTILDYYWDFDDGEESRSSAPAHVFDSPSTYTVTLRVVSAGGLEGVAEATITVGAEAAASLQFDGTQYANLPVITAEPLAAFTFEAWCNPDSTGGTLVNFGAPNVGIAVSPTDGTMTLRAGSESSSAAAALDPGRWQHVAVSYSSEIGAAVYLGGVPVTTVALTGEFDVSALSLGAGFSGKIASVRFWSVARDATEIAAGVSGDLTGFEAGLLGDWPLNAGSGQVLTSGASGTQSGTLGSSDAVEAADPAWSSDSP